MPVKRVGNYNGAQALVEAIAELEAEGASEIGWGQAGAEYVITYKERAKPGPKPRETR